MEKILYLAQELKMEEKKLMEEDIEIQNLNLNLKEKKIAMELKKQMLWMKK